MAFKGHRWQIIVRVAFILTCGYGAIYVATQTYFWLVGIWLGLFTIIGIVNLILFLERTQRDLTNFLQAVRQEDFSYASNLSRKRSNLANAYADLMGVFKKLGSDKESHDLLLQTVISHISTALVVYDENEKVVLANSSASDLFGKEHYQFLASLMSQHQELKEEVTNMEQHHTMVRKVVSNGQLLTLSIRNTQFTLNDVPYSVVSFQDIKNELDENELDSWQKLIRVLTHEIMNSAIPISTLTSVLKHTLLDNGKAISVSQVDEEKIDDLIGGLGTIENRSKGLVRFTEAYRSLTKVDLPKIQSTSLFVLVSRIIILLNPDFEKYNIQVKMSIGKKHQVQVDPQLLEQVIVNLLRNALDALMDTKTPQITLESEVVSGRLKSLSIRDNGPGIDSEILDQIFIPFYTTKENGSGIGLSLSRQILRAHGARLEANSTVGEGTEFKILF